MNSGIERPVTPGRRQRGARCKLARAGAVIMALCCAVLRLAGAAIGGGLTAGTGSIGTILGGLVLLTLVVALARPRRYGMRMLTVAKSERTTAGIVQLVADTDADTAVGRLRCSGIPSPEWRVTWPRAALRELAALLADLVRGGLSPAAP
jgi:hypothetical protein